LYPPPLRLALAGYRLIGMPILIVTGWLAVLIVLGGFLGVMWLCRRFPNQFGMFLWSKRREERDNDCDSG
jgi:hypothetical protein